MPEFNDRTGETSIMKCGLLATVLNYRNAKNIDVQFENGQIATGKSYTNFKIGNIKCPMIIECFDDYAKITNPNTRIKTEFLIDIEDLPLLGNVFWSSDPLGRIYKSGHICLHRLIMNANEDQEVDHADGDPSNNRKSNLRKCSHAENMRNIPIRSDNTSKYKGVYWDKRRKRYTAKIIYNGKQMRLGTHLTIDDAAKAYNDAAIKFFGEFAKLNIIP